MLDESAPLLRPTGNVTFLFTDIEGSTKLWETQQSQMQVALASHDALLRTIMARHGGYVFKVVGDAFCVTFSSAPAAVAAAIDIQRELTEEKTHGLMLRVRASLHTGTAEERGGDYFGPTVNRVARLLIGAGRQTVLSLATQSLVVDALPEGVGLLDLGWRHLKDLQQPEHVFQLLHRDLPADFPPLKSLDSLPNNLPEQLTSFIGREAQLAAISERLKTARLLTLTGSGGSGKTRLALQVAADQIDRFEEGVWLIPLAALNDSALVVQAVASVLHVREQPGRSLQESLLEFIKPRSIMLVLDNCEHLSESCARLMDTLLRSCPRLRILATSRSPLGVSGENIQAIPPLDLPDAKNLPVNERDLATALMRSEATSLFVERARAVTPSFSIRKENATAVIDICQRLDGIPLAIELAAARIRVLSAEQIATRLDDRFRLLVDKNRRTDLPRQQTLRAMIDWSHDLLTQQEQILLRRLSVFTGGWTLEAAETVCVGEEIDEYDILDLLSQLVDKSLVFTQDKSGSVRYRLLETVREYAREKLDMSGETRTLAQCHGTWFARWAVDSEVHLAGEEQGEWLEKIESEHENLRATLDCLVKNQSSSDEGLRMAAALWRFWTIRGYLKEGRAWLTAMLAQTHGAEVTSSPIRAKALTAAGSLAWSQGDYPAARVLLEENLTLRRGMSNAQGIADALNNLGNVAADQGDYSAAESLLQESLNSMRSLRDTEGIAATLNNLARVLFRQGNLPAARALYEESFAADKTREDEWGMANSLCGLAQIDIAQQAFVSARSRLRESLILRQTVCDLEGIVECLEVCAELASAQNQLCDTVLLHSASKHAREFLSAPLPPLIRADYDEAIVAVRQALPNDEFENADHQGATLSIEQAAAVCLQIVGFSS